MDENQQGQKPTQPVQNNKPAQRFSLERQADGTISVRINVPANEVEVVRESVINELLKNVEVQGFRKGTAPRNIAIQKLNPETVNEEVLKKILTDEYVKAVKALDIKPIINPRIHVEQFSEGTPLEFIAETCENPKVDLGNYKEEVRKIKPATSQPKIIVPGSETSLKSEKDEAPENPNKKLDEVLDKTMTIVKVTIPKILVDQETNRLLSQLLDELKRLGVTLDQYLASRAKNADQLRAEYDDRAERDLKLEFTLRAIADQEKITVEQQDVENALGAIKDENERKQLAQNPYLVAAIIRQQKTLDFLGKL